MPRKSVINYNPALTVKENADNNKVSESAIRSFIKNNLIDRRYDRKQNIIADCRKYLRKHPKATKTELQVKTGHSLSTIRKYWEFISTEKELTDFDSEKSKKRQLRQSNNFYATHPSITQDILREEPFFGKILEPFCGSGIMAEVIKRNGYYVDAYDIIDRGYGKQADFFTTDFPKEEYDIITNPPYDDTVPQIVSKCLDICKNKVAMLLPIRYLSGKARYDELFKPHPPIRVYVYLERINIAKNADFETYSDKGANMTIYAWYVWEKGHKGITELRWIHNKTKGTEKDCCLSRARELYRQIEDIKEQERNSCQSLRAHAIPTMANIAECEHYDASKYRCCAYRKKNEKAKGLYVPFGNMNNGFPFIIGNKEFPNSEVAYIMGKFSNNTPEHFSIQEALLENSNAMIAKRKTKVYKHLIRPDWEEMKVQWMLYVIWQKVIGNPSFRKLLMAVDEGAMIIEDTTFHKASKGDDTSAFWGAKNQQRKDFGELIREYLELTKSTRINDNHPKVKEEDANYYCNMGEYIGCNVMGKILTICKRCITDGTEPPIDLELLKDKHIFLFGEELTFQT